MGIRINVVMGWGLPKYKGKSDRRLSDKFRLFIDGGDENILPRWRDVLTKIKNDASIDDFNRSDAELSLQQLKDRTFLSIYDIMHTTGFLGEYTKTAPLVFIPINGIDTWWRHDNPVDYYESRAKDSVKMITDDGGYPCSIFPHYGYVDRRTGTPFRGKYASGYIDLRKYFRKKGEVLALKDCMTQAGIDCLAKEHDIHSLESLEMDIVPDVPSCLKALFAELGVFENPLTMYELRPMIYKFWC